MKDFRDRVNRILKSSTKTFGEEVIFYPNEGGVYKVRGVFDHDYELIDPSTEKGISGNQPALGVNLNDLQFNQTVHPIDGDRVKIRNLTYRVYDSREDGQGGATLFLHRIDENATINPRSYR